MKSIYAILILALPMSNLKSLISSSHNKNLFVPGWHILIDETGKPREHLSRLLKNLSIEHDETLSTIVPATQKAWLRPKDKERWELKESFEHCCTDILEAAKALDIIEDLKPRHTHYDYAILHGSYIHDVKDRLSYLIKLSNESTTFNTIIVLTGERPLEQTLESIDVLHAPHHTLKLKKDWDPTSKAPPTEREMIQCIIDQTELTEDLHIPISFISASATILPDGSIRRPTTATTVQTWLARSPKPGTCLAISNQPYVIYQDAVLMNLLPDTFYLETVGPAMPDGKRNNVCADILDTIARILYEAQKYFNKVNNSR